MLVHRAPSCLWLVVLCLRSLPTATSVQLHMNTDTITNMTTPSYPAEPYCYNVNGVCFIWASPCSGVVWCGELNALSTYDWFCPWGLRYATQSEWDAAYATLDSNRDTFFQKCAASQLDPRHDHCDYYNTFVREPDNSYNELVLVCPPAGTATPSPTPSPTVAAGSPTASPTPSPTFDPTAVGTGAYPAEPYCYNVNGVCFIWASPCSGVVWCGELNALSTYDWFCPWGLRYATQSEWDAAYATLDSNRDTFFQKCAASQLDPRHDHCDYYNTFVREPDNSYNELVLVCPPAGTATPSPTPSPTVAAGSPTASPTPSPTFDPTAVGTGAYPAEPYCYNVNGVCFIWASPCSGVVWCGELNALSTYDWFCPWGLRYATQSEWDAAYATLDSNRDTFFQKCAASQLDSRHDHCDYYNTFVREPDNSYNELVLVCPPAGTATPSPTPSPTVAAGSPTASPTPSPTAGPLPSGGTSGGTGGPGQVDPSGKGDPHLQNVHGQRFDLMKPGKHVLINIPRGQRADRALLRVQAYARRLGGCADMYFQELNVTGSWAEFQQAGGYHYTVSDPSTKKAEWLAFEQVELKVVHGRTKKGLEYLNFYVKHLSKTSFSVGGLLGEDDHTAVTIPSKECSRRVALMETPLGGTDGRAESSVAVASP
ncbi:unnamed protein product [Prorocentrum cordatum]|uniref:Uncharacterized protein n=1 Tax=Prorocentrum cordatum TaxID=2364126 RepID=A0ABN9R4Z9_9DINO|nr:unnamed protein product [Polarella glacialis]